MKEPLQSSKIRIQMVWHPIVPADCCYSCDVGALAAQAGLGITMIESGPELGAFLLLALL